MANTFRYSGFVTAPGFDTPLLVLFNNDAFGSGRKVTVLKASASPVKSSKSTVQGKMVKQRITASSGGDDVHLVKADTSSADVPAEVLIKVGADVTLDTEIFNSRFTPPITASPFATRAIGTQLATSNQWSTQRGEGSTQHIRLAEGEGIAILNQNNVPHPSGTWQLVCVIKIGTELHYINSEFYAREYPTAYFSIMNGSGSGVNVDIVSLDINEVGNATTLSAAADSPYVGYKRIEGYLGGETITPISMDTANSLDSSIELRRSRIFNPILHYEVGTKVGVPSKYNYGYPSSFMIVARSAGLFRQHLNQIADNLSVSGTSFPASELQSNGFKFDVSKLGVVLNPQDGFAIQAMNMAHYNTFYVEIEFTETPPTPPASGGLKSIVTVS